MKLTASPLSLNLKTTFRVAHGASDQRHNVLARLEHDGLIGYGEAAAVPYYGDTQESLIAYLNGLPPLRENPCALEDLLNALPEGARARLGIFADESVETASDVARYAGAIAGVVVKLMKTGGNREALRAIHTARAHGMEIMLSCMVESPVGVTAAAHLAPLCGYLDLDGPLLAANDPFTGLKYDGVSLTLPDGRDRASRRAEKTKFVPKVHKEAPKLANNLRDVSFQIHIENHCQHWV